MIGIDDIHDAVKSQIKLNTGNKVVFYVIEIIEFIILVIGSVTMLWLYTPYTTITKVLITAFALLVTTDIFKGFLLVKKMIIEEETK